MPPCLGERRVQLVRAALGWAVGASSPQPTLCRGQGQLRRGPRLSPPRTNQGGTRACG